MKRGGLPGILLTLSISSAGNAYELSRELSLGTLFTAIYQYGDFQDTFDEHGNRSDDQGRGAAALDLDLDFTPTRRDAFYALVRFAAGNGLNDVWPGPLVPFAGDLEDDLTDIGGSGRNHLLQAWYRRSFEFPAERTLAVTAGLIDSSDYLDQNAYADDELLHFMNAAFTNTRSANLPAYDIGSVAEFATGDWTFTGLVMSSRTGDAADRHYDYYALQASYSAELEAGSGHYRLWFHTTSPDFLQPDETKTRTRQGLGISIDQALGENFGVFVRSSWQRQDAAVEYRSSYSGGLHMNGRLWGRSQDEAGIASAYLGGGNLDIRASYAIEGYVRFQVAPHADLSLDLQYLRDRLTNAPNRRAWIPGIRVNAYF